MKKLGSTDRQTDRQMDMATLWLSENFFFTLDKDNVEMVLIPSPPFSLFEYFKVIHFKNKTRS